MKGLRARLRSLAGLLKRELFQSTDRPALLAAALGLGVFLGIFPVWGLQTFLALVLAHWLKLNKALVLAGTCISLPPFLPIILWASYALGAQLLGSPVQEPAGATPAIWSASLQLGNAYLLGSILLAVTGGGFTYLVVRVVLYLGKRRNL